MRRPQFEKSPSLSPPRRQNRSHLPSLRGATCPPQLNERRRKRRSNPELSYGCSRLLREACHRAALCADPLAHNDDLNTLTDLLHPSAAQCLLGIAGDPLVAFGQGDQLLAADDIVDRSERPVVGALKHLAQDRVPLSGTSGTVY